MGSTTLSMRMELSKRIEEDSSSKHQLIKLKVVPHPSNAR